MKIMALFGITFERKIEILEKERSYLIPAEDFKIIFTLGWKK